MIYEPRSWKVRRELQNTWSYRTFRKWMTVRFSKLTNWFQNESTIYLSSTIKFSCKKQTHQLILLPDIFKLASSQVRRWEIRERWSPSGYNGKVLEQQSSTGYNDSHWKQKPQQLVSKGCSSQYDSSGAHPAQRHLNLPQSEHAVQNKH